MAQTEIKCQGVSARMMELVYGELSGDDRAALEAHLAACASCRSELSSFQSTRASARRALDGDLPPPRAHQAILRAAAAAVAATKPSPIEARAAAPQPSFWDRWRARWTLPTFATVGALAVVVLASKVFLEPDKTVDLGRQPLRSAPTEAPAGPPATERQARPTAQAPAEKLAPAPIERERRGEAPAQLQQPIAQNAPAPSIAAPAAAQRRRTAPDGFGAVGGPAKGAGAASSGRARAKASDGISLEDESAVPSPGGAGPAKREFAPPPPPLAEPARQAAPSPKQAERDLDEEALDEGAPAPRASAGRLAGGGTAPPPARAKAKKAEMPAEMPSAMDNLYRGPAAASAPAASPAPAAAPAASTADKAARSDSPPVAESPAARADRLFAQGQWAAAARAYRDLLRRDPNNGDAARWRQRLAASDEAASAQAPAAAPAASPARR